MPRVHHVKAARKANAVAAVGESYYWWKFRRGGKQVSKEYPSRSQLTQSPYYATQYDAEDAAQENLNVLAEAIRKGEYDDHHTLIEDAIGEAVQPVRDAAEENSDALHESAQSIEDGFGHSTYLSEELEQRAEEYEQWGQESEDWAAQVSVEDPPAEDDDDDTDLSLEERLQQWRDDIAAEVESIDVFYQGS